MDEELDMSLERMLIKSLRAKDLTPGDLNRKWIRGSVPIVEAENEALAQGDSASIMNRGGGRSSLQIDSIHSALLNDLI